MIADAAGVNIATVAYHAGSKRDRSTTQEVRGVVTENVLYVIGVSRHVGTEHSEAHSHEVSAGHLPDLLDLFERISNEPRKGAVERGVPGLPIRADAHVGGHRRHPSLRYRQRVNRSRATMDAATGVEASRTLG